MVNDYAAFRCIAIEYTLLSLVPVFVVTLLMVKTVIEKNEWTLREAY